MALWWALALFLAAAPSVWGEARLIEAREAEGKEVAQVEIERLGERPIRGRALRAAMVTQEGKRFKRRFFRDDLLTLVNLYRSQGYRNAEVARKRVFLKDNGELRLVIQVC